MTSPSADSLGTRLSRTWAAAGPLPRRLPWAGLAPLELELKFSPGCFRTRAESSLTSAVFLGLAWGPQRWCGHAGPTHQRQAPGSTAQETAATHHCTPSGEPRWSTLGLHWEGPGARVLTARTGLQQRLHCSRQPEDARSCVAVHCGHWRTTSPQGSASPLALRGHPGHGQIIRIINAALAGATRLTSSPPDQGPFGWLRLHTQTPAPHSGGRALTGPCPIRDGITRTATATGTVNMPSRPPLGTTSIHRAAQVLQHYSPGPASGLRASDKERLLNARRGGTAFQNLNSW